MKYITLIVILAIIYISSINCDSTIDINRDIDSSSFDIESIKNNRNTKFKVSCDLTSKTRKKQCLRKINYGPCDLRWVGTGCCKKTNKKTQACMKRYSDGGCKPLKFCNFKCPNLCNKQSEFGCVWEAGGCVYKPDYEYGGYEYTGGEYGYDCIDKGAQCGKIPNSPGVLAPDAANQSVNPDSHNRVLGIKNLLDARNLKITGTCCDDIDEKNGKFTCKQRSFADGDQDNKFYCIKANCKKNKKTCSDNSQCCSNSCKSKKCKDR